ncbi:MAG: hypothetical protein ABW217_13760 [Polyangiaceae bacterium]
MAGRTEQELNAPTTLTLRLLGVVAAFTFLPWLGGKVACNDPVGRVRVPFELASDVLARNAKSAALELQQRASSKRFREASELASGELQSELLAAEAECEATPARCESQRAQGAHVVTRAVVVSSVSGEARVRAESRRGEQRERVTMKLRQTGDRWYVVSRTTFEGELEQAITPAEAAEGPARAQP